jgi:hypothetical protein
LKIFFGAAFLAPAGPKVLHRDDCGFRCPQHASDLSIRLVVKLRRVAIQGKFDSLAFLPAFQIGLQLAAKRAGISPDRLTFLPKYRITSALE